MLTAIVGINWGDEGKGGMVDLLSADYDIVARYQGGNNAGHTVSQREGQSSSSTCSPPAFSVKRYRKRHGQRHGHRP